MSTETAPQAETDLSPLEESEIIITGVSFGAILAKLEEMYEIRISEEDLDVFKEICEKLCELPASKRANSIRTKKINCGNLSSQIVHINSALDAVEKGGAKNAPEPKTNGSAEARAFRIGAAEENHGEKLRRGQFNRIF